jgi:prepilin-type N-terminal cleavage/methylation domain-containing protein
LTKSAQKQAQGFTLVELLVVIAIVAILAAIVVLIINPLELTRRGRDAARLTDLTSLQNAINVAVQESTGSASILCVGGSAGAGCSGDSNPGTAANRNSNGTGWVKVNLSSQKSVSVPTLPVDPVNDATYHYTYATNTPAAGEYPDKWEINAILESDQYKPKMGTDGGDNTAVYEVGSDLVIIP